MSRYSARTQVQQPTVSTWGKAAAAGGVSYGVATGGDSTRTIVVSSENYTELTFNNSGTLTVTSAGLFDFIFIGGGSGGGGDTAGYDLGGGGGGGAGGLKDETLYLAANETITIGAGGAGVSGPGHTAGSTTQISAISPSFALSNVSISVGGGDAAPSTGAFGGSGGGGAGAYGIGVAGLDGRAGSYGNMSFGGSGGGGAGFGAVGTVGSGATGGNGGAAFDISAWRGEVANTTKLCGGGGGGAGSGGTGGASGGGGAGAGANDNNTGTAATANTGSGGGGGSYPGVGAAGGKGVVYVRFKI